MSGKNRLFLGITALFIGAVLLTIPLFFSGSMNYKMNDASLRSIKNIQLSDAAIKRLSSLKGVSVRGDKEFLSLVSAVVGNEKLTEGQRQIILAAARDTFELWGIYAGAIIYMLGGVGLVVIHSRSERSKRQANEREKLGLEELGKLEKDFEEFDKVKRLREEKDRADFLKNVGSSFVLQHLRLEQVSFFSDSEWVFQPGVNILLGRNGYGKSLLLRTLAALLTRDEEHSEHLLREGSSLELQLIRNSEEKIIRREQHRFVKSIGKVPILAIPDSRFLDRTERQLDQGKIRTATFENTVHIIFCAKLRMRAQLARC